MLTDHQLLTDDNAILAAVEALDLHPDSVELTQRVLTAATATSQSQYYTFSNTNNSNFNKPWSAELDTLLLRLRAVGKSIGDISRLLQRTQNSVANRIAHVLDVGPETSSGRVATNTGTWWSTDDDRRLRFIFRQRQVHDLNALARIFGRSPYSILCRLSDEHFLVRRRTAAEAVLEASVDECKKKWEQIKPKDDDVLQQQQQNVQQQTRLVVRSTRRARKEDDDEQDDGDNSEEEAPENTAVRLLMMTTASGIRPTITGNFHCHRCRRPETAKMICEPCAHSFCTSCVLLILHGTSVCCVCEVHVEAVSDIYHSNANASSSTSLRITTRDEEEQLREAKRRHNDYTAAHMLSGVRFNGSNGNTSNSNSSSSSVVLDDNNSQRSQHSQLLESPLKFATHPGVWATQPAPPVSSSSSGNINNTKPSASSVTCVDFFSSSDFFSSTTTNNNTLVLFQDDDDNDDKANLTQLEAPPPLPRCEVYCNDRSHAASHGMQRCSVIFLDTRTASDSHNSSTEPVVCVFKCLVCCTRVACGPPPSFISKIQPASERLSKLVPVCCCKNICAKRINNNNGRIYYSCATSRCQTFLFGPPPPAAL